MGLTAGELSELTKVVQRLVDLNDHMSHGIGGKAEWQYIIRICRMDLQTVVDAASKPVLRSGGLCGWCHEYISQERNLFKHVQKCRAEATAEQRAASKRAVARLAEIAKDLEKK